MTDDDADWPVSSEVPNGGLPFDVLRKLRSSGILDEAELEFLRERLIGHLFMRIAATHEANQQDSHKKAYQVFAKAMKYKYEPASRRSTDRLFWEEYKGYIAAGYDMEQTLILLANRANVTVRSICDRLIRVRKKFGEADVPTPNNYRR